MSAYCREKRSYYQYEESNIVFSEFAKKNQVFFNTAIQKLEVGRGKTFYWKSLTGLLYAEKTDSNSSNGEMNIPRWLLQTPSWMLVIPWKSKVV